MAYDRNAMHTLGDKRGRQTRQVSIKKANFIIRIDQVEAFRSASSLTVWPRGVNMF